MYKVKDALQLLLIVLYVHKNIENLRIEGSWRSCAGGDPLDFEQV
jgi:hypothetical protein